MNWMIAHGFSVTLPLIVLNVRSTLPKQGAIFAKWQSTSLVRSESVYPLAGRLPTKTPASAGNHI